MLHPGCGSSSGCNSAGKNGKYSRPSDISGSLYFLRFHNYLEKGQKDRGGNLQSRTYKYPKSAPRIQLYTDGFHVHKSLSYIKNSFVSLNYFILSNETTKPLVKVGKQPNYLASLSL